MADRAFTDVDDAQEASPATDVAVKLNHVLPSQVEEETKVHRRGLMLVPGLAANHEAQPPLYLTVQEMCIS
jgi:hypothetical protein